MVLESLALHWLLSVHAVLAQVLYRFFSRSDPALFCLLPASSLYVCVLAKSCYYCPVIEGVLNTSLLSNQRSAQHV
jgi:hypothetical protein